MKGDLEIGEGGREGGLWRANLKKVGEGGLEGGW